MAVRTLATRLGRNFTAEGVAVVPMGGAAAFGVFLEGLLESQPPDVTVAGLCDVGEVGDLQRGLARSGFGFNLSREEMEACGFFLCVVDLEDELIRSLGQAAVEGVIADEGELASLRTLQNQPAWRGQPSEEQLRRFMGSKSGRKARYGSLLAGALDLNRLPRPLGGLLNFV